jgi:hypothetical protein
MFSVVDDDLSINQHVIDADRVYKRLFISSEILDRVVVEADGARNRFNAIRQMSR